MSNEWTGVERRRAVRKRMDETVLLLVPWETKVRTCGLRDLTVLGVGLRLRGIATLPRDFELSFDHFRTNFPCRLVCAPGRHRRAGVPLIRPGQLRAAPSTDQINRSDKCLRPARGYRIVDSQVGRATSEASSLLGGSEHPRQIISFAVNRLSRSASISL